ncbi:MAG: SDR family NAD(P)-dependent oxidoreductase [Pseudomonadales bacterium]
MRWVLITGSCSGIGLAVARHYAGAADTGVVVAGLTREDLDTARGHIAAVEHPTATVRYHQLDVRQEDSVLGLRKALQSAGVEVDVLINCAGVMPPFEPEPAEPDFFSVDPQTTARVFDVNALGILRTCQAFVPGMLEHGSGRIVNVASEAASLRRMLTDPWPYALSYRVSKVAVNALTVLLARSTAGTDVLVNSVCPGWVRTAMGGTSAPLEPEAAIATIVHLADLPAGGATGRFFSEMRRYGFPQELEW